MLGAKEQSALPIGAMLKRRRKELGLTLKELSDRSGVSAPFISQAERSLTVPSMVSLMKLSKALNVELKYFMEVPHDDSIVHRADGLPVIDLGSPVTYLSMSSDLDNQQMDALLMKIPPGHTFPIDRRDGEDFLYVLEGEIISIVGDVEATLKKGDAMHFDSRLPHTARNETDQEVVLLYVGTPSIFR